MSYEKHVVDIFWVVKPGHFFGGSYPTIPSASRLGYRQEARWCAQHRKADGRRSSSDVGVLLDAVAGSGNPPVVTMGWRQVMIHDDWMGGYPHDSKRTLPLCLEMCFQCFEYQNHESLGLQIKMLYPKDGISIETWWNQLWWFSGRHLSKPGPSLARWWWHHLKFNQWHGQWLSDVDPSCPPWKTPEMVLRIFGMETWHPPPTTCWILYCIPSKPVVLSARLVVNYPLNFDLCPKCPQAQVVGSGGYYGISHITEYFFFNHQREMFPNKCSIIQF